MDGSSGLTSECDEGEEERLAETHARIKEHKDRATLLLLLSLHAHVIEASKSAGQLGHKIILLAAAPRAAAAAATVADALKSGSHSANCT